MTPDGRASVGPNAITQLIGPLREAHGEPLTRRIFAAARLEAALDEPPARMVPEAEAAALFAAVRELLPGDAADAALRTAGLGTARYIHVNRIPAPLRGLLPRLPFAWSARLLLSAIEKHAWTFAGSGHCQAGFARPFVLTITSNPLATPGCPWHRAVFEGLFGRLVRIPVRIDHAECCGSGDAACRFVIRPGAESRRAPVRP